MPPEQMPLEQRITCDLYNHTKKKPRTTKRFTEYFIHCFGVTVWLPFKLAYAALQNISYLLSTQQIIIQELKHELGISKKENENTISVRLWEEQAPRMIQYKIPLVPPITLLNEAPMSFIVSAASFSG